MNPRVPIIIVSLAANLALGWLAWQNLHPPVASSVANNEIVKVTDTDSEVQTNTQNEVVKVAERFDWSRLASADWKQYRDRLRAVHCAEKTVRVIIRSEIEEEFIHRRRALLDEFQRRFWEKLASRELDDHDAIEKPIRALDEERKNLIEEVLGAEPEDANAQAKLAAAKKAAWERSLAWLPSEKRQRLIEIQGKFDDDSQALAKEISAREKSDWTDADQSRQKQLRDTMEEARNTLLTANEQEEWKLRHSNAESWASLLPGLEVNEDQWHAGAKVQSDYNEAINKLSTQPNPDPEKRKELDDAMNEQMQSALGTEQFAKYQAAKDGKLQLTRRITERFQLPDSLADEVTDIQKQASAAAEQVAKDAGSSPEDRAAALAAVREETLRSLQAKISGDVWTTYQRYNGDWIKKIFVLPTE